MYKIDCKKDNYFDVLKFRKMSKKCHFITCIFTNVPSAKETS